MKIAYDCTLFRPGCVLLQAAYGCDPAVANLFPVGSWLLAPTPGLRVYEATPDQLVDLIEITEDHTNARSRKEP